MLRAVICIALVLSGCASIRAISDATKTPDPPVVAAPAPPAPVVIDHGKPSDPAKLEKQMTRIAEELTQLQNAVAKLIASSRQQEDQLQSVQRRLTERESQTRSQRGAHPDGSVASPAPTQASINTVITAPAEDLFRTGTERYQAKELDAAFLVFSELVAMHPDHPLRESAQFLVAEILYAQDDCRGALAELEALLAMAPQGSNAPDALLKIGLCQHRLGDQSRARRTWERLVKEHPKSASARQAATLLKNSHKR
jgi:TolA-binding protein